MNSKMIVTVAVVLSVFLLIVIPIISSSAGESWEYDDYRECDPADTASGAIEILTIGGKTYLHAKDVGSAVITHNGSSYSCNVSKARLDLIFIYGQSNAAYRNPDPTSVSPKPLLGTGYYFGFSDRYAALASENNTGMAYTDANIWTMYDDSGNLRIGDKAPSLTYEYNRITGHKVYIVDGAIGGRPIVDFLPPTSYVWEYGKAVLERALSLVDDSLFELHYGPYVWIQGEANGTTSTDLYYHQFLSMHTSMMQGGMGIPFKTAYLSLMPSKYPNSREAQILLSEDYPSIIIATDLANTFTVENGLLGSDNTHYTQEGNNLLGKAIGERIASDSGFSQNGNSLWPLLWIVPVVVVLGVVAKFLFPKARTEWE